MRIPDTVRVSPKKAAPSGRKLMQRARFGFAALTGLLLVQSGGLVMAQGAASAFAGPVTTEYSVLILGERAGQLQVESMPSGYRARFSYRNNGRGPDIDETVELGPDGLARRLQIRGRATFGAEIREDFRQDDGRALWTSVADSGDEPALQPFAFVPLESSPAYGGALAQALMLRADGAARSIGGLRLSATEVARLEVKPKGSSAPLDLALVAITGADAQPWYVWQEASGARRFVGYTYAGWAVIRQDLESAVTALTERQTQAMDDRLIQLRRQLARPLDGLTLIRGVRWFDAPAARLRGPSDIWLMHGRIAAVTPPGKLASTADWVVDGTGRTLLPGLWDMHAHLWPGALLPHLAGGVVNVREPAGKNEEIQRLMKRLASGELPGPGVVPMGFIEGRSPFSSRNGRVVDSLEAGLAAVDDYAARGYMGIKLYNSIRPQWVKPLAARAHALGLHVGGHVPAFMTAEQAVRAGYDELTHINQVMLNFVARPGDDTRTLLRFERVGADGHTLDLKGPKARAFLRLLRERRTVLDLTMYTFEAMFSQQQGQPNPSLVDVAEHLPVLWRRGLRSAEMELSGDKLTLYRRSFQRMLELCRALHEAGLTLVPGTDGLAGLGLHRELALYVKAGIAPAQALRTATWNAARVARQHHVRGRIAPGFVADLVLIDGDPVADITQLRRASLVLQGTVAYEPAAIYESMGFKPFVPAAVLQRQPAP